MKDKIISGMSIMLLLFVILSLQSFAISPGADFNVNINEWDCSEPIYVSGKYKLEQFSCSFDGLIIEGDDVIITGGYSDVITVKGRNVVIEGGSISGFVVEAGGELTISGGNFLFETSIIKKGGKATINGGRITSLSVSGDVEFSGGRITNMYIESNGNANMYGSANVLFDLINRGSLNMNGGKISVSLKFMKGIVNVRGGDINSIESYKDTGGLTISGGNINSVEIYPNGHAKISKKLGGTVVASKEDDNSLISGGHYGINPSRFGQVTIQHEDWHVWDSEGNISAEEEETTENLPVNIFTPGKNFKFEKSSAIRDLGDGIYEIHTTFGNYAIYDSKGTHKKAGIVIETPTVYVDLSNTDPYVNRYYLSYRSKDAPHKYNFHWQANINEYHSDIQNALKKVNGEIERSIDSGLRSDFLQYLKSNVKSTLEQDVFGASGCSPGKHIAALSVSGHECVVTSGVCPIFVEDTACCGNNRQISVDFGEFNIPNANSQTDFNQKSINPLNTKVTCKREDNKLEFNFDIPFDTPEKKETLWKSITT